MDRDYAYYKLLFLRILIVFSILLGVYFCFMYFFPALKKVSAILLGGFLPFILAVIVTAVIDPYVDYLDVKKGWKRGLAVALILFVLSVFIILIAILFVSRFTIEITRLYTSLPTYANALSIYAMQIVDAAKEYLSHNPLPAEANEALNANLQNIIRTLTNLIGSISNLLLSLVAKLPYLLTLIIVTAVASFFISRDKKKISRLIYRSLPSKYVPTLSRVIGEINMAILGFFRAQIILISVTASISIIGLYIIKSPYALSIGIIVGLFDLLPILGPGTILIPWGIYLIAVQKYTTGIFILILYAVIIVVRQSIEPKILSHNIGLHPLATLLSLYVGLKLIGIIGVIAGPFLVILLKSIYKNRIGEKIQ